MTTGSFSRERAPSPQLRVTDRDRDAAVGVIQDSYAAGRLTKAEHDTRVGHAIAALTYEQLDQLTADLPGRPAYPDAPVAVAPRRTNGLAVAALVCGIAQPFTGMITTIPAIALGHVARSQIRRSGEDGRSMATWGLALGWAGLAAVLVAILLFVALIALVAHATGGHS